MKVLEARDLAVGWGGRAERILASGIDLVVEEKTLVVLVGPNGSGKSTLLRTLAGLQEPLRGSVLLGGEEARRLGAEERSRRVASVFTDRYDAGYFSVFDIVAFGRYPYTDSRGRLEARDLAAVDGALAATGLEALASRPFSELSDGEKQKALIARSIAQDCPLLVLDEPTAFLDAPARAEVFRITLDLARRSRKAVVLSTHDVDRALSSADRLWIMDREHRFRSGAPEDLAIEGFVGRAFDGPGLRFDPESGVFRAAGAEPGAKVEIEGGSGASRTWTERLAERLGLGVVQAAVGGSAERRGRAPIARVRIEEGEAGPTFSVLNPADEIGRGEGRGLEAGSFAELEAILRPLAEEREP